MTDMTAPTAARSTIRTLRFHGYGEPGEVLRLEEAPVPSPGANRIRVVVHACGLNPADWALCRRLYNMDLPRGIGIDVSGTVDAVGEGVTDVAVGDKVLGFADFANYPSAGASDVAVLDHWAKVPAGLDMNLAAALPMAAIIGHHALDALGVKSGQTLLIHGGGSMMGFSAVQIARARGIEVFTTAGSTYADKLRGFGATVTAYGDGMVERVKALGPVDLVLDTVGGALPDLIRIVDGDPKRVLSIADRSALQLGVRGNYDAGLPLRYETFGEMAQAAAAGKFSIPIARTFPLEQWREAMEISMSGKASGKLLLLPGSP
ncbi:Quinone oxidoreductase [Minicystis rosea]|nr:Quinone oxidoreductase [Minicystis rosea]